MPSRHKPATPSGRYKGLSKSVQTSRKSAPKRTQSQQVYSSVTTKNDSDPSSTSLQPSTFPHKPIAPPEYTAQKRKHTGSDGPSEKRLRRNLPLASELAAASQDHVAVSRRQGNKRPGDFEGRRSSKRRRPSRTESQLSEVNLDKLQSQLENRRDMEPGVSSLERVRKRGPSRQPSSSDLNLDTASVRSQKSAVSLKFYRYHILARARIYVHPEPPPTNIQSLLDGIFKRKVSDKKRREISRIAKDTSQKFIIKTRGANREDDLVELIYEAFRAMFKDEMFNCPRKADWDPILKPDFQREEVWDQDAFGQETHDIVDRPTKRQQADRSFPSPDTSQSTVRPPVTSSQPILDGTVKNPRPDFTIGHYHSTITDALMDRGLSRFKANDFLRFLQTRQKLLSDPTVDFLDVRFPILVIEGKAYATGKTAFEAENQAAVSGGSMINLQRQLSEVFESVFPERKGSRTPLAFSICMEGPVIQLWVHHYSLEENISMHYMSLLRLYHGSIDDMLEGFLLKLEQLMGWYREDFLRETVDQLFDLANHIAR